jgi:hypothetical protein
MDLVTEDEIRDMCEEWLAIPGGRRYQIARQLNIDDGLYSMNLQDSVANEILRRARKAGKIPQLKELLDGITPLTAL